MRIFFALVLFSSIAFSNQIVVTDADIVGDVNWTNNNTYLVDKFIYVESGESLTIEAGTIVKFKPGIGTEASGIIVSNGGKIFAQGTSQAPIIFTSEFDDPENPLDLDLDITGLWSGIIICGNAPTNIDEAFKANVIEGFPANDQRVVFGGDASDDNSGVLEYVSIRYTGTGWAPDIENNGLTLAGVGSGTTLRFIEVLNGLDDGIEFLGGTAEVQCAGSFFCDDDAFDYDAGFNGKGQFWCGIAGINSGDNGGEFDGGYMDDSAQPYAIPTISNITLLGSYNDGSTGLRIRDNAGGKIYNSIIMNFEDGLIDIESNEREQNSKIRLDEGDLEIKNSIFYNEGVGDLSEVIANRSEEIRDDLVAYLSNNSNLATDPLLQQTNLNEALDLNPGLGSPALNSFEDPGDDFFQNVNFIGAFGPGVDCFADWSALEDLGYTDPFESEKTIGEIEDIEIQKRDGNIIYAGNERIQIMPNTEIYRNDSRIEYSDLNENDVLDVDYDRVTVNRENRSDYFLMARVINVESTSSIIEKEFKVFASNNILNINSINNYDNIIVNIYDGLGKNIFKNEFRNNNILIDINSNNLLLVEIIYSDKTEIHKIIN